LRIEDVDSDPRQISAGRKDVKATVFFLNVMTRPGLVVTSPLDRLRERVVEWVVCGDGLTGMAD
jgi:hypothetical protein